MLQLWLQQQQQLLLLLLLPLLLWLLSARTLKYAETPGTHIRNCCSRKPACCVLRPADASNVGSNSSGSSSSKEQSLKQQQQLQQVKHS